MIFNFARNKVFWQSPACLTGSSLLMYSKISLTHIRVTMLFIWLVIFFASAKPFSLLFDYGGFFFLGLLGAIFANSTGAGGGVVFIPFFNQLEFSSVTSIATSFAIQCCGMTAGAITWWAFYRRQHSYSPEWTSISKVLLLTVPVSILGLLLVQINPQFFSHVSHPDSLHKGFGVFSIILAMTIFATIPLLKNDKFNTQLTIPDICLLPVIALIGGGITAWLSIGVGELVAVYLIMRRFNIAFAIAAAVILSAFTVWAGIAYHIIETQAVYWPVVMFAGAGAIIGGVLAKRLVLHFSAKNLKIFFAGWIFILGVTAIPL
ncbi:MAG: putative membrane protein YfcA [Paraglaciecola sp.]